MTERATTGAMARHDTIAELLDTLDALSAFYRSVPGDEPVTYWSAHAELITGEVARALGAARARLALTAPALPGPN